MTEDRNSIDDLFAEWNANHKQQNAADISDEQAGRLIDRVEVLLDRIAAVTAKSAGEIAAKVFIAKTFTGARWTDGRDIKMLDSIQRDLTQLAGAPALEPSKIPRESIESRVRALEPWAELYARWLKHQAYGEGINAGQERVPGDEEGQFLADEESAIVREMIGRPTVTDWQLAQKIEVLEHITMPDPSDWADKRDRLLLASIKDDVLAMGGRS